MKIFALLRNARGFIACVSLTLSFATAIGQQPIQPEKYEVLTGESGNGSGFIIRYYSHLCGVTSLHQFDGKTPSVLESRQGSKIELKIDKVIKQKDVQTQALVNERASIPFLDYQPRFRLGRNERVVIFDATGQPVEAKVFFSTFALEYTNLEGPKMLYAKSSMPLIARGASGSPVIQKSTGAVVGVFLGADDPQSATSISFETLCLPDLSPKPAAKPPPEYSDPKQKEAFQNFVLFAKGFPAIHWKASDIYLKAHKLGGSSDTLDVFTKENKVSEMEVVKTSDGAWEGRLKLGDETIPSEYWRYQFIQKNARWTLKGGQKFLGDSSLDLFAGDRIMRVSFEKAFSEVLSN